MFKIIDNFLPKNEFNKIQKILMSDYFPWYFNDYVTSIDDKNEEYYFTHVFFINNCFNNWYWYRFYFRYEIIFKNCYNSDMYIYSVRLI